MKHGKHYNEKAKLIESGKLYEVDEAIALVKKTASAKFDETVEVHIRTSCDGRHADQHRFPIEFHFYFLLLHRYYIISGKHSMMLVAGFDCDV